MLSNINKITSLFRRVKKDTLFVEQNQQHLTSFLNFITSAVRRGRGGCRENHTRVNGGCIGTDTVLEWRGRLRDRFYVILIIIYCSVLYSHFHITIFAAAAGRMKLRNEVASG